MLITYAATGRALRRGSTETEGVQVSDCSPDSGDENSANVFWVNAATGFSSCVLGNGCGKMPDVLSMLCVRMEAEHPVYMKLTFAVIPRIE